MIRINIEKELLGDGGRFSLRLDLHIKKGEFVTLFGRSGSGKTTVLRMISGLEKPDRGKIEIDGKVYFDSEKGIDLPPQKRNIGFVFQNYALFPNMTVLENILFAMDRPDREKAIELLKTVHLEDLKDRYPDTLSGGQQQRVAVARALAREPSILLLDEPLSALDFSIREKLQEEIKRIHRVFNLTTILVSHDKTEVFKLSDRVVWIEKGRIIKEGSPRKVFIEKNISGKFSFIGNVLQIKKADTIYIATIEIGDNLVEVVLSDRDEISVGDKVIVSSKAFNPVVKKIIIPIIMINFEFSQIRIEYKVLKPFRQPYFLGSSFRGILGRRLRKIVCIKPREECINCEFKKSCPYTVIFETESILNQPSKYVLKPPYERRDLKEGDTISVDITLLGAASNYWEFITESLNGIFNLGKERYIKTDRVYYYHPFDESYYPLKSFVPRFDASSFFDLRTGRDRIRIRLYPSSIKIKGDHLKFNQFDKDIFLKAMVLRISNVAVNYGIKSERIFLNPERFQLKDINLKPSPMERWSNRKKRKMKIPAFEGSFTIEGDLEEVYPYIELLRVVNIGKSVSFGLGRLDPV